MSERSLLKFKALQANPELIKDMNPQDLAGMVSLVLDVVRGLEKQIKEGKLQGYTPQPDKDYLSKNTASKIMSEVIEETLEEYRQKTEAERNAYADEVKQAIARLEEAASQVKDGTVTDEEIGRAAQIASGLIELPDFDAMVSETFTANPQAIRNGLELLQGGERYRVQFEDVEGMAERFQKIQNDIKTSMATSKPAVVRFVNEAIDAGQIVVSGGASDFTSLTDTPADYSGQAGKVVAVNTGEDALEFISASGVGTVTSVAVSGSDGIEVDSGSPITAAGTIALGINKTNLLSHINVEDGADVTDTANVTAAGALMDSEVTNLAQVKAFDSSDYATASQGALADTAVQPAGLADYQKVEEVNSSSKTAELNTFYVNVATSTYTDPSPSEGRGFTVFVRNATATVGGTSYSTVGTVIRRIYHSGGWANYVYQVASTFAPALGADDNYVTDAEKVVIGNTSGTNTGDQTSIVGITGTKAQFDTAVTDGNFMYIGDAPTAHTQTASDITDFDTEVANNSAVTANSAKLTCNTTNVTNAGAVMDSELTNLTFVKALDKASSAEVTTGTNDTKAITPAALDSSSPRFADVEVTGHIYADGEVDNGNSSTADTIDWGAGNFQKSTMTGNCTYTFTAPDGPGRYQLMLVQDGTGSRTATWPASVKWPGGTAPTLSTAASAIDIITFYYDGTSYYGVDTLDFQ